MNDTKTILGNAVIGQSGGPTAVINQSLVGCVSGLSQCADIKKVFGARHGVRGMVEEDFVELHDLAADQLERLNCGAAYLDKLNGRPLPCGELLGAKLLDQCGRSLLAFRVGRRRLELAVHRRLADH